MPRPNTPPERVLRVVLTGRSPNRHLRVTIPGNARITFAPIQPRDHSDPVLRIYQGTSQLAVFRGVESYRDESAVKVSVRVQRERSKTDHRHDGKGNAESSSEVQVEHEWVELDPDGSGIPF